jgi:type IV secretion system protein VirD4
MNLKNAQTERGALLFGKQMKPVSPIGFSPTTESGASSSLVSFSTNTHITTIAKSGSGKGRSSCIPNLLTYEGSCVVLDVKAELYYTVGRARRELGQQVRVLDPFHWATKTPDRLNIFDLFSLSGLNDADVEAQNIAQMLSHQAITSEPFWDVSATALVSGIVRYTQAIKEPTAKNLSSVIQLLMSEDVVYGLAVALDTGGAKIPETARRELAAFLQLPDSTRGGVLATASSYLKAFNSEQILHSFSDSTFSLEEFIKDEERMTIFIIIPPAYILSHFSLVKLWFYVLLKSLMNRREIPELQTIFFLDEVSQFGHFSILENIMTIGRGYGITVWLFLQSLHQLQKNYDTSWRTMLGNCEVLQLFASNDFITAKEMSEITGITPEEFIRLGGNEQFIIKSGKSIKIQKLDYLTDEMFVGRFDSNPFYKKRGLTQIDEPNMLNSMNR